MDEIVSSVKIFSDKSKVFLIFLESSHPVTDGTRHSILSFCSASARAHRAVLECPVPAGCGQSTASKLLAIQHAVEQKG